MIVPKLGRPGKWRVVVWSLGKVRERLVSSLEEAKRIEAEMLAAAALAKAEAAPSLAEVFWANVDKSGGPESCWPWRGPMNRSGYGNAAETAETWCAG